MSSNPQVNPSVVPEAHSAACLDPSTAISGSEEGAVGGILASNEANSGSGDSGGSVGVPAPNPNVTNSDARKVITLFGGFSRIEHSDRVRRP